MKFVKFFLILLTGLIFSNGISAQGVVISDDPDATVADESAVLDIQSTSKGMLIPRMTTAQRNSISNAKDGLLVFDITEGSFYLYGKSKWTDLSTPADLWTVENSNVRLTNTNYNLDMGNSVTTNNIIIQADENTSPDDPIFEVKDKTGKPVMQVTSEGVKIFVSDQAKGVAGGFAVGRYTGAKGGMDTTYFTVNKEEGTRVYTSGTLATTGQSGGFAVGRYTGAKGMDTTYFSVNRDEGTQILQSENGNGLTVLKIIEGIKRPSFITNHDSTRIYYTGTGNGFACVREGYQIGNDWAYNLYVKNNGILSYDPKQLLIGGGNAPSQSMTFPTDRGNNNQKLTTNGAGLLTWEGLKKTENKLDLKDELESLKKENAQLRKDIEEIKALLKNNSK